MVRYLSDDWIERVDQAMSSDAELTGLCSGASLSLQQEVHSGPDGDVVFHVTLGPSGASITSGPAEKPDVRLRQSHTTATAIRRGELNALDAVQSGQIELSGDVAILANHRSAMARLEIAFGSAELSDVE